MGARIELVLDLDETLVHSTERDIAWGRKRIVVDGGNVLFTAIRSGAAALLTRLCPLCRLWIYTAGTREYAEACAGILEDASGVPRGSLFGARVLSRTDTGTGVKSLAHLRRHSELLARCENAEHAEDIFDSSRVVVLDDRRDCWATDMGISPNDVFADPGALIHIERWIREPVATEASEDTEARASDEIEMPAIDGTDPRMQIASWAAGRQQQISAKLRAKRIEAEAIEARSLERAAELIESLHTAICQSSKKSTSELLRCARARRLGKVRLSIAVEVPVQQPGLVNLARAAEKTFPGFSWKVEVVAGAEATHRVVLSKTGRNHRAAGKVVSPEWFVDSMRFLWVAREEEYCPL
jgi:hypothetical protein